MQVNSIYEAKTKLSKLVDLAVEGKEVIIGKSGKPMVKLVPYRVDESPRKGGQWKGKVKMAPGFDEFSDELAEMFGLNGK